MVASVSTESPAISDRGIRGGGAETASGREIPGGLCVPEGWRDKTSDVHLRTPGMYTILNEYGRVFSFKLRNLALLMSARARSPKILIRGLWSTAMKRSVQPRMKWRQHWRASTTARVSPSMAVYLDSAA